MDKESKRLCPFLDRLFPWCYCMRPESIWAARVVEFCAGRFELCEYYRLQRAAEEEGEEGPGG